MRGMVCWADGLQDRDSQGTLSWVLDFFLQFWRLKCKSRVLVWAVSEPGFFWLAGSALH